MASEINFLLLVELIVVVIVASAFLFYWNRLLGSCLAFFIRLYTWRSQSAYISIGSLQISPLAGRISFRDVEYHSSNLSFRALHGHVTWRYWKLRVRQEADSQSNNSKRNRLPCRINVYAEGVECFVFNRTPAYDAIVERMKKHEKEDQDAGARTSDETLAKQKSNGTSATGNGEDGVGFGARLRKVAKSATSGTSQTQDTASSSDSHQKLGTDPHALPLQPKPVKTPAAPGVNWFREALPVELHIVTGSLVLGSDASPSLLIGNFERTDGTLEITDSRSACDDYKLLVNLNFEQATVLLRTNVDYSGPLLAHGKKVYDELLKRERDIAKQPPSKLSSFLGFHALSKRFAFMHNPKFSSPPVAGMPADRVWKGLARYRVDPDNTSKPAWREEREYAKRTELITASSLQITYYADTPGLVPSPEEAEIIDESDEFGNVEAPPEYGIDIIVHSGKINYGPWADRQRDALQKTFAPSIFFDSEPKPRLQVADQRIHANMIVNVQLVDKTSLRIPTREPSKDWEHENKPQDAERRYGWLDVVVGENSSINYTQSQFATGRGYDAILVLHLDSLVISSSVNYLDFLQAQTCKLSMTMPTPLSWNARRDWGLDLTLDSPKISLLRDHVTLISDLAKDWSSGQLGDFHHFVPNHYNFRVTLLKYEFQLCVNDFNIIDHPGHRDANALMDIAGPRMEAYVAVGATQYRPEFTTIPFSVNVDDAVVKMSVPKWDTHRSFADDVNFEVGKIGHVSAKGTYTYYSTPHPDHQEMLVLHLEGKRVVFKALGWVLRRMFCTKDNYFGAFTNFATSPEFLEKFDHDPEGVGDKVEEKYRPGRSDALNVQVTMNVEESLILLSEQVHGCVRGIAMPVPQLQMALKSVEHFMELSLDALPTYIVATDDMDDTYRLGIAPPIKAKEAVFIEGIELKANRLFGPQPYATTYLCLWEFTAPRITAFLSAEFVSLIQASVAAVIYNFTDLENAPASFYIPKTPPDVTFFKLGIDEVAATLFTGNTAVSLSMPDGVNLDTSSWATRSFSSAVGLVIPVIKVHLLEQETYRRKWVSMASIDTALALDVFSAPSGWREKASEQQKFLKREDGPTKRIWYMYQKSGDESDGNHHNMLYLPRPRPRAPEPVEESSTVSTEKESIIVRETSSAHSSSAHTSEEESDAEFTGRIPLRRRSRSFATARETMRSSMAGIGDESDSVSDSTASSGNTSRGDGKRGAGYDMAGALAERLTMFRSAHEQVVPTFPAWTDDNDRDGDSKPMPKPSKGLGDGAIIRVVCKKLDVELGSRSVNPVMTLVSAMRSVPVSPEIRLDQLVTHHTDKVMADVSKSDSKLIDLCLPEVRFKINTPIGDQRNDVIDVRLRNVYGSILTVPEHDLGPASTDIIFGSRSALITSSTTSLTSGQMSLSDATDNMLPRNSLLPVIQARIDNLQVGFTGSTDQQIRAKVAMVDVQMVTAAAACLIDVSQSWEDALAKLPPNGPSPSSPAQLVYDIIQKALASDIGATSPSFRFEGGYELHAEDQRSIRRDPGWIMLARLRHWTRQMELNDDAVRHIDVSDEDMAKYIISELARVEEAFCQDESLVVFQPFIKDILGHTAAVPDAADERDKRKSKGYFVNLGDFTVQHRERSVESSAITTSVFGLRGATAGVQKSDGVQDEQTFERLRLLVAVKEIHSELQDGLLPAIETLLKLANDKTTPKPASGPPDASARRADTDGEADAMVSKLIVIDVQLQDISLSVVAGGLRLRLAVRNAQQAVARRQRYPHIAQDGQTADEVEAREQKLTHDSVFLCVEGINLALLQPQDDEDVVINSPDRIVALFKVENVRSTIDLHTLGEYQRPSTVKVIFGVESVEFDSRPQLRAFLAFARDWQKRHLGNYRPIINDIRALIAKDRQKYETLCVAPERPGGADTSAEPDVTLDLSIGKIQLQVRAAKAVWLRWDVGKLYISRRGCTSNVEFGVRIAPQVVGAYTSMKKVKGRDASSIKLPSLTAIGSHRRTDGKPHISAAITLGFFVGVLKPAVLDRLLSLHQRLGTDILHIVQEYRETVRKELAERHAKYTSTSSVLSDTTDKQLGEDSHQTATQSASAGLGVFVDLRVSVAGVRFGLRADDVATTLLFEALSLRGQVTNTNTEQAALLWRAKVDHFGLSLGHLGSAQITDDAEPIRKHRSAYMVLDIDVQEIPSHQNVASQLNVSLNRVHTVMHVAALSELSDLVRSWQSDIHILRDNRASEVAEVKETTTKILKKLDASDKNATLEESWFASRLFTVNVVGFGIAVPLDEGAAIDLQHRENTAVPAMLFSTRVVSFQNRRNETARFKIQQMALQFLEKFDQGAPEHFTGDYHPSTNRMLLPSLDCEAQMSSVPEMWSLSAHVSATDFKLSLAPDVVDGVFKLIDLYDAGKDRLAELERQYRVEMAKREALDSVHAKYDDKPTPSPARKHQQIVVRMSYTFNSGIVELHRSVDSANVQFVNPFAGGPAAGGGTPRTRCWHDTFVLPTISLWMDYAGPTAVADGGDEASVGTLVFNSAVHESRNTLRPTMLPFFVDLVNRVERRHQRKPRESSFAAAERKAEIVAATVSESTLQAIAPTPGSTIRLRVTLRIDRSELRLSCAPDSNAYVDLKWESGGFMASCAMGGSDEPSTVAGSISGVTASLSHEFAEKGRSCIEAGAKDLAFSVAHEGGEKGISVVLDTQLSGQFLLDAFSAWLIFTSVWIDNAPRLDVPLRAAIPEATSSSNIAATAAAAQPTPTERFEEQRPKMGVAAIVRFRTIDFDADVAVTHAKLEITPIVLRTISNGEKTDVNLSIGTTKVTAKGDISGNLCSDKLVFNTLRRSSRASEEAQATVLSMSIDAGDLRGNLFLGEINILRFHLEPAVVTLADDWASFSEGSDSHVSLAFGVKAGQFRGVIRLLAIPRLLGNLYSVLDMVDSQQRIATQRSETFKVTQQRKTDEPSPVAAVILHKARRVSAAAGSTAHVRTAQTMRFDLAGIDVGVFNEDYEAGGGGHVADFYRFVVGKVEADLKRSVKDGGVDDQGAVQEIPVRQLGLLVSLVQWDTSDGAKVAAKEKREMAPSELIEMAWKTGHKGIASLPSMTMNMASQELSHPSVLDFDFDLVWGETDGDIGILPNFFEQAVQAFKKLVKGIDEQQLARARRTERLDSKASSEKSRRSSVKEDAKDKPRIPERGTSLEYRPRDPMWADDPPIPKLKQLGESTGEAARFIPRIKSATKELPVLSHRFVTLPLEEGMDLLLKLYEKQLPERV